MTKGRSARRTALTGGIRLRDDAELRTLHMSDLAQRRLLRTVLAINGGFFVIEIAAGLISSSMGLVADSLDMLADALVYGLSLAAIGSTAFRKVRVARISGYLQMLLALLGLAEVLRRMLDPAQAPAPLVMALVSLFALVGNVICLFLLRRHRHGEAHLQASWIFTNNDVLANVGVIVAAPLVYVLHSPWPDLIIGLLIFALVMRGAIRILRLGAH